MKSNPGLEIRATRDIPDFSRSEFQSDSQSNDKTKNRTPGLEIRFTKNISDFRRFEFYSDIKSIGETKTELSKKILLKKTAV